MRETPVWFLVWEVPNQELPRSDRLPTPLFLGFTGISDSKEFTCNEGDLGSIPWLGISHGGGYGNPLQYSSLENPHGQKSLVGYSPWGCKELDTTDSAQHSTKYKHIEQ